MNINKEAKIEEKFTLENLYNKYDGNEHLVGFWVNGDLLYGKLLFCRAPSTQTTGTFINAEYTYPEMGKAHIVFGYLNIR